MLSWRMIFRFCMAEGVPRRSLFVALIVGTALNAINQGDVLITGGDVSMLKIALTFIVPYCVATYGAVSYQLTALKPERRPLHMAVDPSTSGDAEASRSEDQQ